jgi:uncharacterized membrane protein (DUF4010 family)
MRWHGCARLKAGRLGRPGGHQYKKAALIMLLTRLATAQQGGMLALGGLSGLLDVDPITLASARLAGHGTTLQLAAETILIAGAANGLSKAVLGQVFGGWRLGSLLSAAAIGAILAGGLAWVIVNTHTT